VETLTVEERARIEEEINYYEREIARINSRIREITSEYDTQIRAIERLMNNCSSGTERLGYAFQIGLLKEAKEKETKDKTSEIEEYKKKITACREKLDPSLIIARLKREYDFLIEYQSNDIDSFIELAKKFREILDIEGTAEYAAKCDAQVERIRDEAYGTLVERMEAAQKSEDFLSVAGGFRAMGEFRDAVKLTAECESKEKEITYNALLQRKGNAQNAEDFEALAREFRTMNGYLDAAALAAECESKWQQVKYTDLMASMNNAQTIDDFTTLAEGFRSLHDYQDSKFHVEECEKRAVILFNTSQKSTTTAILLCIFFGWLGAHRFYLGKPLTGILYFFTMGLGWFGSALDAIRIAFGKMKDADGKALSGTLLAKILSVVFVTVLATYISLGIAIASGMISRVAIERFLNVLF
jgi:restriction system protein